MLKKYDFDSNEGSFRVWLFFREQINYLESIRKTVMQSKIKHDKILIPILYSIYDTSESISTLSKTGKIRDCFILARAIIETIINTCFILAKGEKAILKAERHALQKSFRDLKRELDIQGHKIVLSYKGVDDIEPPYDLKKSLEEFTSKRGKEVTSWSKETLLEKIGLIYKKYGYNVGVKIQFSFFAIYRHASEIAHGSLFGLLFPLGFTIPGDQLKDKDKFTKYWLGNLSMVLFMLGFAISALISVISIETSNFKELVNQSNDAVKNVGEEVFG